MRYVSRLLDERIERELRSHAVVALVGPSGSGKLSCALHHAASVDVLDVGRRPLTAPGVDSSADEMRIRQGHSFVEGARIDPSVVLAGADPHLVADVLAAPVVLGEIRPYAAALQESKTHGVLLLTLEQDVDEVLLAQGEAAVGGAVAADGGAVAASGGAPDGESKAADRVQPIQTLRLLPLSLQEMEVSDASVSLEGLFAGVLRTSPYRREREEVLPIPPRPLQPLTLMTSHDMARVLCRGGWPETLGVPDLEAITRARELAQYVVRKAAWFGNLSTDGVEGIVWALASHLGEVPTFEKLASGIETFTKRRPARDTVRRYLFELEKSQVIVQIPGWVPPGVERIRMRTKPRYYFVDPSVAVRSLSYDVSDLTTKPQLMRALLANLLARDLLTYVAATGEGRVCHYLDERGLAADFIVERRVGGRLEWGAMTLALGESTVEDVARDLRAIARKNRAVEPAFLAVVVARGGRARQREDGVFVVPLASLGA